MTSLTSQLITQAPVAAIAAAGVKLASSDGGDGVIESASASERDALAAADAAEKLAAEITGQMEKVASQGGQVPDSAAELRETLEKLAHYVPELVRACQARMKYAEFCLEQATRGATRDEALKVASEMHADGMFEVPDGQTFADVVDSLEQEDLPVFKRAYDLVASGRLTSFGEVDESKQDHGDHAVGDSDDEFLRRHAWLLR